MFSQRDRVTEFCQQVAEVACPGGLHSSSRSPPAEALNADEAPACCVHGSPLSFVLPDLGMEEKFSSTLESGSILLVAGITGVLGKVSVIFGCPAGGTGNFCSISSV